MSLIFNASSSLERSPDLALDDPQAASLVLARLSPLC
jgi:hypothetical protein